MISNQKVKVKTLSVALQSPFVFSCSWGEGKLKRALNSKKVLLKTMAFCSRHIMRVYPAYYRLDSSNFGPQKVWNVGVQMVALNTQTYGRPQAFNMAKFESNGGCGYILKPMWLRRKLFSPCKDSDDKLCKTTEEEGSSGSNGSCAGSGWMDGMANVTLSITPIACWLPHTPSEDEAGKRSGSIITTATSLSLNTSTTHEDVPLSSRGGGDGGASGSTSELEPSGVVLHAVVVGGDPNGFKYRKIKRSSTTSMFHASTAKWKRTNKDLESLHHFNGKSKEQMTIKGAQIDAAALISSSNACTEVVEESTSSMKEKKEKKDTGKKEEEEKEEGEMTSREHHLVSPPNTEKKTTPVEFAAWHWNDATPLEFEIFEPGTSRDGMELLHVTLHRKKRIVGQFSIAVINMRPGIRVVTLRSGMGQRLPGNASLLIDVQIARRERDQDYDPNSNIDSLRKVSSSNCLKNPLRG